ncbi:MAG: PAS domain-containing protein [Bryobacteraceae bacterium]|jgi:PAS domain S-box-containing protein
MDRSDLEQWKPKEVARLLALVEAERRYYQEIVAGLPIGLMVLTPDLSIVSANLAVRRVFGLRSGDPLRGRLDALLPSEVLDQVRQVFSSNAARNGVLANLLPGHGAGRVRIAIQPIRSWDYSGEQEVLLTIEEMAEPTAELSPPQPEVEHAAETMPEPGAVELLQNLDAIVWAATLPDRQFLFVSDAAERVLGWTAAQWTESPTFQLDRIHPGDRERVEREYTAAMESGAPLTLEFRVLHADGGWRWLSERVRTLLDDDGTPRHLVGFAIDITAHRHEEQARVQAARADALTRLCSRLAHDMNNLLMIVNGYTEEIVNSFAGASALQADLAEVRNAGERLSAIADQLLAFTRRRADDATSLDASRLLSEIAAALSGTIPEGIGLTLSSSGAVWVRAAREQLIETVRAFVEHAVRTLVGAGEITLATEAAGDFGAITIRYAGEVLAPEAWQALFEGILPSKDIPASVVQGISRGWTWVQEWGGAIEVESTPGAGTTVAIRLPAVEPPAMAPEPPPAVTVPTEEPPPAVEPEPQPETVLVVEDETGIRILVRKILERQGYRVLDAPQADAAIRLCQEFAGQIQLVITDVIMPEMGGREMVQKLLQIRPGIKVLYVSGYTDDEEVQAANLARGSAFLQKPFTLGALLDKVREVLET